MKGTTDGSTPRYVRIAVTRNFLFANCSQNFDRCTNSSSLYLSPTALGLVPASIPLQIWCGLQPQDVLYHAKRFFARPFFDLYEFSRKKEAEPSVDSRKNGSDISNSVQNPDRKVQISRKRNPDEIGNEQIFRNNVDLPETLVCYINQNPKRDEP